MKKIKTKHIITIILTMLVISIPFISYSKNKNNEIIEYADNFIGESYVYGGTSPETGFDCSGFVQYVYAHFGVDLPRTSREQVTCGSTVNNLSKAKAGDLIFYSMDGTDKGVCHVGIYTGNNKVLSAYNSQPYPQGGVKVSDVVADKIYMIKRVSE